MAKASSVGKTGHSLGPAGYVCWEQIASQIVVRVQGPRPRQGLIIHTTYVGRATILAHIHTGV